MCSIMGYTAKDIRLEDLRKGFDKTVSRGPDMSRTLETPAGWLFFHRLAIMGLTEEGAAFKKQEKIDYRNDSVKLYERLLNDEPANTEN